MALLCMAQQNGVAERKHKHIVETTLTLLSESKVPLNLWPYDFATYKFLISRLPTMSLNFRSPWEFLFGQFPNYSQ